MIDCDLGFKLLETLSESPSKIMFWNQCLVQIGEILRSSTPLQYPHLVIQQSSKWQQP